MNADQERSMLKILVLKCNDCGAELNRTIPLAGEQLERARSIGSVFAAGKCPNGCRSTFSDLNINTTIEEIEVAAGAEAS
jgi:hypothetical protein